MGRQSVALTRAALLAFLFGVCAVYCQSQTNDEALGIYRCNAQPIPDTFNTLSMLDFNQEFHLQGEYMSNFTNFFKTVQFTLTKESLFRIYVAPHESDVDLWLYQGSKNIGHSSLEIGTYEALALELVPGDYTLKLNFFGFIFGTYDPTVCDTITMEVSIVPLDRVLSRFTASPCPTTESLPVIEQSNLEVENFAFTSNETFVALKFDNVTHTDGIDLEDKVRWLTSYNFTLAEIKGQKPLWSLEAKLGFDFLTAASLGLALTKKDEVDLSHDCLDQANCTSSAIYEMNQASLKAVLGPGEYSLWIFDHYGDAFNDQISCLPFTFEFAIKTIDITENFVTCDAPVLPTTLMPGFYDEPEGYLHVSDNFLMDLEEGGHVLSFEIRSETFFRVYIAPHRIDIDLRLLDVSANKLIEYSLKFNGDEESIVTFLEPGNYNLSIAFFGHYEYQFCETFYMELALGSELLYTNDQLCSNQAESTPNLANIDSALVTGNKTFILNNNVTYVHKLPVDSENQEIDFSAHPFLAQNFTIGDGEFIVKAHLGKNFLLGDITLGIADANHGGWHYASVSRNSEDLYVQLGPGTYTIVLETGPIQSIKHQERLNNYPPCIEYTLSLLIIPVSGTDECTKYDRLPTTLNTPQYLGRGSIVHFDGDYLIPLKPAQFSVSETIEFKVVDRSFFRVWSEPHRIDVDFRLYEGETIVASTWSWEGEEEVTYTLAANTTYRLNIAFYRWASTDPHEVDPPCFLFHMELGITPLTYDELYTCTNSLPANNTIPLADGTESFFSSEIYYFTPTDDETKILLPFTVTDEVYFRAEIRYDFIWSDLSLLLRTVNQTHSYAESYYNRQGFKTALLPPGNYILEIHEPQTYDPELRRCASFWLDVGYEPVSGPSGISEYQGCPDSYPPTYLNIVPFLSAYTGYFYHEHRNFLIDVDTGRDNTRFTITTPSIFSFFIPTHDQVDVDIFLYNNDGTRLARSNGVREESITLVLQPDDYILELRFYGLHGSQLPKSADCPYFPAEVAIEPLSHFSTASSLTKTACTNQYPAATAVLNQDFQQTFVRSLTQPYSAKINFTLTEKAIIEFDVAYDFASSSLYAEISGLVSEGLTEPVHKTFYALVGYNHIYYYRVLFPGTYTIDIKDTFVRNNTFSCSSYNLFYKINTTAVPDEFCDDTEELPTDLYTEEGGSEPFGGPQDADGSVRIYSDKFPLDTTGGRHHYILFNIVQPSFVRIFLQTEEQDDIDFFIYKNQTRAGGSLVYSSIGVESVETGIVHLEPQANPYLLDVYFFNIVADPETCPTFHFELAIKTETQVEAELTCPNPIPTPEVPPPSILVDDVIWVDDSFVFTSDRIEGNTIDNDFIYRMTINAPSNSTILSSVGYDFLANNFALVLRDSTGAEIQRGYSDGSDNRDDYINFENFLYAVIDPGTYFLDIEEIDIEEKDFGLVQYCHQFEFFLAIFPETVIQHNATIESIRPSSGSSLNPYQDLNVVITFSVPVKLPTGTTVLNFITDSAAVYMIELNTGSGNPTKIKPIQATFGSDRRVLGVDFSKNNFQLGKSYQLIIDAQQFQTDDGHTFELATGQENHVYIMATCDCSGHGHCASNSTSVCVCDIGYSGSDCSGCAAGYHLAGTECITNLKCSNNSCNFHGRCDDSKGYPLCYCDLGYGTKGDNYCSVCALGYTGYPDCIRKDESGQRSDRCTAPLLPHSLDNFGFLEYNGHVHLRDNYFIDYENIQHSITFSLSETSVLRIYTEPHKVDIDVWLYRVEPDDKLTYIDAGVTFNQEEVLFHVLEGKAGSHPTQYLIKFRYFTWSDKTLGDCETFNLELEIEGLNKVNALKGKMDSDCNTNAGTYPTNSLFSTNNKTFPTLPQTEVFVNDTRLYGLSARNSPSAGAYWFHFLNFEVKAPLGKMAYLTAEIGHRFLVGELALLLESGNSVTHCGKNAKGANCFTGSNFYNRNRVAKFVPNGNYTLWFYEPEPQNNTISSCSIFTFNFHLKYEDLSEDKFYCNIQTLPSSLASDGYIDLTGYMHIEDTFLLFEDTYVPFTITKNSYMRVWGKSDAITAFVVNSIDNSGKKTQVATSNYGVQSQLFVTLQPGKYSLLIESFFSDSKCPSIHLEWTIQDYTTFPSNCGNSDSLPSMSNIHVPYILESNATYKAYLNNPVIRQWTFVVDQLSIINTFVDSDFMTSALALVLDSTRTDDSGTTLVTLSGKYHYNRNYLHETLEPGSYTLRLIRSPQPSVRPANFPLCAEFEFGFDLRPATVQVSDPCSQVGEPLPESFNSIRYLGNVGRFGYQSAEIRVPDFSSFTTRTIPIEVKANSLFRAYTEPHSSIDIDLALYEEGVSSPLVDGGYGINSEESIMWLLEPGKHYYLQMIFWKWGIYKGPTCPTFNMEVAVIPDHQLPPMCNRGGDHWPSTLTGSLTLPFVYNSVAQGENLYYQQRKDEERTHDMDFTVTSSFKLYALLKYEFTTGDFVMRLTNKATGINYFGENALNGDLLRVTGLPSGDYKLTFYEATASYAPRLGCSTFDFEIFIETDINDIDDEYDRLPSSLDTVPFLKYSGSTHLQDNYILFGTSSVEAIFFTITEQSFLRITANHEINNLLRTVITLTETKNNIQLISNPETIFTTINSGSYRLTLNRNNGLSDKVITNIELAIDTVAEIVEDTEAFAVPNTCKTTATLNAIVPNPDGYYAYANDDLLLSQSGIIQNPIVQSIPVTLDRRSIVYVQTASQFLISDFIITIVGLSTINKNTTVVGRNGRNLNELNAELQAGNYAIHIYNRALYPSEMMALAPHCTTYSLRISIQDALEEEHVDCADYNVLPWDLNTANGGSAPFGGPIDSTGTLNMRGRFLMPSELNEVDTIKFSINRQTLISVIAREEHYGQLSFRIQRGSGAMKLLSNPKMSLSTIDQRGEIFLLDHLDQPGVGSTNYELEVIYGTNTNLACPAFDLMIVTKSFDAIGRQMLCPMHYNEILPKKNITTNEQGVYSEYTQGSFTDDMFSSNFKYEIAVSVTKNSIISANLGFNSLATMFQVELLTSRRNRLTYAAFQTENMGYGQTNINQLLTGTLLPGDYIISITIPNYNPLPYATDVGRMHCLPFIWSVVVVPSAGVPYIKSVDPSVADNIDPTKNLLIEISFSSAVYVSGKLITSSNSDLLKQVVYLRSPQNEEKFPVAVEESSGYFTLLFNGPLTSNTEYSLSLKPDLLYDSNNKQVMLITTNKYKMIDTTCSGNGEFDRGICFCKTGFAGTSCETCDVGYENVGTDKLECVQKTGKLCYKNSCGCDPKTSTPTNCVPKGTCNDTTGAIVCHCFTPYAGSTCQSCQDGYVPNAQNGCSAEAKCGNCVRGFCDESLGKCICPEHFDGKLCDQCAEGWAGDDCSVPIAKPYNTNNDKKWQSSISAIRILSIVIATIMIVATIGFLLFKRFASKKQQPYAAVFETLDMEDNGKDLETFNTSKDDKHALVQMDE